MKQRQSRLLGVLIFALIVLFAVEQVVSLHKGHSASTKSATGQETNIAFHNELKMEMVTPISSFNPTPATSPVYKHVEVYTKSGRKVMLDASKTPLLFTAYWCPHCQRTLVLLRKNLSSFTKKPIVVAMGYVPHTTLREATQLEDAEVKSLGLQGLTVYYLLDSNATKYVPVAYPTLVFMYQGKLERMNSEHTLAVWEKALS